LDISRARPLLLWAGVGQKQANLGLSWARFSAAAVFLKV
jgi:hypothetical protein